MGFDRRADRSRVSVKYDRWRVVLRSVGKRIVRPARMAGRQAQKMAAVVSTVDQMVMGTFEKVASMVMPKLRRLLRRMMDVRHTLLRTGQRNVTKLGIGRKWQKETYKLPMPNMA